MSEDWSGGGYGRYPGLSMAEIRIRFDRCVAEPSWRSVSAIFRIAHEQIDARGRLGIQRNLIFLAAAAGILLGVSAPLVPDAFRTYASYGAGFCGFISLLFLVGALKMRHTLKMNLLQEREIRKAALAAVSKLLDLGVEQQPLTREQRDMLHEMVRKERFAGTAKRLLD